MQLFELFVPRHLEIIYETNRRFLHDVQTRFPGDDARTARMSLIEETPVKQVRMANLAILGSHSTKGVAATHSELLRTTVVKDFADMFPQRFNNKTNGVTPRRWLLLANPDLSSRLEVPPHTFLFAGKAAPPYHLAKLIIKLIGNVATVIDADPAVRGRLKVLFLPEYNVSLAERLIPASDVSEQISTAGYEASGTSNMKFMMNGALTVGTRDGATIEMAKEGGEENFFLFGLTAEEVLASRGWYKPHWHYEHEPEIRFALDMIRDNAFSHAEHGVFTPIWDVLITHRDHYMHLADLSSCARVHEKVGELYA